MCDAPADLEIAVAVVVAGVKALTATGVNEPVVVPLPSWPAALFPQHFIVPPERRAKAWADASIVPPAAIAVAVVMPLTATEVTGSVVVPSPSSPELFLPTHLTVPTKRPTQVMWAPAEIAVAVVMPVITTGIEELFMVPSPSWWASPCPQQFAAPLERAAQVW